MTAAQASLDAHALCERVGDTRPRRVAGVATTVGDLAAALRPAPARPFPATLETHPHASVTDQALGAFRGNAYSVPPWLAGRVMTVRARLGEDHLQVVSPAGAVLARHSRAPDGAGAVVRDDGHVAALEEVVLAGAKATPGRCAHKVRRLLSVAALGHTARLRGEVAETGGAGEEVVVVDLAQYAAALAGRASTTDTTLGWTQRVGEFSR